MTEQNPEKSFSANNPKESQKLFKKYLLFFVVVFLVMTSFFLGLNQGKKTSGRTSDNAPLSESQVKEKLYQREFSENKTVDFALFWRVWDLVKEKHIDSRSIDAQNLVYGAIKGMLKATNDPYTSFMDPEETKDFAEQIEGTFEGIGAELGIKDEILTIIAPLADSPAEKSGLKAGDKILRIDDRITSDLNIDEAVDLIKGKKGTQVRLTILSEGDQQTKEVQITRDTIDVKSVKWEFKENDIAHIEVNDFGEETTKEFRQAVNEIMAKKSPGIILDLRNNPGGLVDKSVELSSFMIPKGRVVVIEEDYKGKRTEIYANGGDKLSSLPTVVLINSGSASASEIMAGALKDNRDVSIVGEKSFGKGSVQELIKLSQGTSVKITIAKWLTPKGSYIMEKGISPDIEVKFTEEDLKTQNDPQLNKALEILKEQIK